MLMANAAYRVKTFNLLNLHEEATRIQNNVLTLSSILDEPLLLRSEGRNHGHADKCRGDARVADQ